MEKNENTQASEEKQQEEVAGALLESVAEPVDGRVVMICDGMLHGKKRKLMCIGLDSDGSNPAKGVVEVFPVCVVLNSEETAELENIDYENSKIFKVNADKTEEIEKETKAPESSENASQGLPVAGS